MTDSTETNPNPTRRRRKVDLAMVEEAFESKLAWEGEDDCLCLSNKCQAFPGNLDSHPTQPLS